MQIKGAHFNMMCGRMMLGEIIRSVGSAPPPIYYELSLTDTVTDPIKSHVDCFGTALLDSVCCESDGGAVVGDNWCGGLEVP